MCKYGRKQYVCCRRCKTEHLRIQTGKAEIFIDRKDKYNKYDRENEFSLRL